MQFPALRDCTIGLGVGALDVIISSIIMKYLREPLIHNEDYWTTSEHRKALDAMSFFAKAVTVPVGEEAIRGLIQWDIRMLSKRFFPTARWTSIAEIVIPGILFGAYHLLNCHNTAHWQAIMTGASGITNGFLQQKYGWVAAAASHIGHNSLVLAAEYFNKPSARPVS